MIEIKDLCFSYGKSELIKNTSLTLSNGCITSIIGENGSGKTTLIKLISGELKPNSGSISVDEENIGEYKKLDLAKRLSYFPQGRPIPDMNSIEAVALARFPYSYGSITTPKYDFDIAMSALETVGITELADKNMTELSFGERQKVYLAMLISQDTKNCILDEPTNFLDISAKLAIMRHLKNMRSDGRCILCILHDIPLALGFSDRIIVMKNGRIAADGSPEEIVRSGIIEEVFKVSLERIDKNGKSFYTVIP